VLWGHDTRKVERIQENTGDLVQEFEEEYGKDNREIR